MDYPASLEGLPGLFGEITMSQRKMKVLLIAGMVTVMVITVLTLVSCEPGPPRLVISGRVVDAATGQAISGARVSDDGYGPGPQWHTIKPGQCMPWGAITDPNGRYQFLTWPEHHGIKAEALGYQSDHKGLYSGHLGNISDSMKDHPRQTMDFALQPQGVFPER